MSHLLVFASGTKDSGGSGFRNLVEQSRGDNPQLEARIVAVVSNHPAGGVRRHAEELNIPFIAFEGSYQDIIEQTNADWVALSGWLKLTQGLDPRRTINIHPGPLPRFGGRGMYGHHVHEAVIAAYQRGEVTHSAISMHFVTDEYDQGTMFFQLPVLIEPEDTPETLQGRVNLLEHFWQPIITNEVISGRIRWDGHDPASLVVPDKYQ